MKKQRLIILAVALGLAGLPSALACEFHGGGLGYGYDNPYGQDWLSYYEDKQMNENQGENRYSTMSDMIDDLGETATAETTTTRQPESRVRPSFSSSATRASNAAKARLAKNGTLETATLGTSSAATR